MGRRLSRQAPPDQQGAVSSMMSLTTIIGPLALTQTLGRFTSAGAPIYFPALRSYFRPALQSWRC